MGQAKLRGSYETRKAEGEARREREEQQRRNDLAAREAALTNTQRAIRERARKILVVGAGIAASWFMRMKCCRCAIWRGKECALTLEFTERPKAVWWNDLLGAG